jgi:uncharacterized protein (TIGR03083 family)
MSLFDEIAAERLITADLLAGLDDDQLATASLCGKWTVRDVAGHLAVPFVVRPPVFVLGLIKAGGNFHRANDRFAREVGKRPIAELAEIQRRHANSHFTPPGHGPSAPMTDLLIHGQDIRRPLGLIRDFDPARLRVALDLLSSPRARRGFVPNGRLDGLHLRATDLDWSTGVGPEVAGPAESLLVAMAGRPVGLADLTGEGVAVLRSRI